MKSPVPKFQSAESGILKYWLELATNFPLAPPNSDVEVSIDAPLLDVMAFGATVCENVELDSVDAVVVPVVDVVVELEVVMLVVVVVVFVVCDPIVNV